ncbi:hypothetical protein C8F01DRAFT_1118604 [Mycena amicta]|nr:hypothetical protein C8F01DRAFT_1118604 [Mycena amicta]
MAGVNPPGGSHFPPPATRQQLYGPGLAAGAEDVKYQAKYKDLKRKVKEIEHDNDKLHYKILQAKRSIQRMKLERAYAHSVARFVVFLISTSQRVLYERLQQVPANPEMMVLPSPGGQLTPHSQPREAERRPQEPMLSERRGSIGYSQMQHPSTSHPPIYHPPPPQLYPEHSRRHVPAALPGPDMHELAARSQQHPHSPGLHRHMSRDEERERGRPRDHSARYDPPPPRQQPYYSDRDHRRPYSRSNSPVGSASGSAPPDGYDVDRERGRGSFRLRPVTQGDDVDMPSLPRHLHDDRDAPSPRNGTRYAPPGPSGPPAPPPPLDSRKRTRNEMEVDGDDRDRDPPMYPRHAHPHPDPDSRSSKRYHPGGSSDRM